MYKTVLNESKFGITSSITPSPSTTIANHHTQPQPQTTTGTHQPLTITTTSQHHPPAGAGRATEERQKKNQP
jgi:hypothetical protein